ncbi:MAG TPA: HDOD domain-containing protein [Planctomycetota bacterium]|nr:HDOD domain-containing protein [Planctomycetota bacterium]
MALVPGDSRAEALVRRVGEVMTLPQVVRKVIDLTHNPAANSKMLAAAIGEDPVLAAKLLRTANSSFFGFMSKTSDIGGAVVRLGTKQVRSLATAIGVAGMFTGGADKDGYSRLNLWRHSVAVGTMNETMTTVCPVPGIRQLAGEALLAGLVHDIGIIIEDQYLPNKWPQVPAAAFMLKDSLTTAERQQFGFTHAEVGGLILNRWKFSEQTAGAVAIHHGGPRLLDNLLGCMTAMSEILVARAGVGYCDVNPERISQEAFGEMQKRLGLMGPALAQLRDVFAERIAETLEVFALEAAAGRG